LTASEHSDTFPSALWNAAVSIASPSAVIVMLNHDPTSNSNAYLTHRYATKPDKTVSFNRRSPSKSLSTRAVFALSDPPTPDGRRTFHDPPALFEAHSPLCRPAAFHHVCYYTWVRVATISTID
jgi:hypothetical protein